MPDSRWRAQRAKRAASGDARRYDYVYAAWRVAQSMNALRAILAALL